MNDFEIRYNAMERANLFKVQRLVFEIAQMKGKDGAAWIDRFRNAVVTELSDIKTMEGGQTPAEVTGLAHSVVMNVAQMAKDRYEQARSESSL